MNSCPTCGHPNLEGSVFCAECGSQLRGPDTAITDRMSVDGGDAASIPPGSPRPQPSGIPTAWGSLHLLESGHVLPLASRPEFTLGRTTEGQPIVPDIDLTPYQAHAQGVSRLHAILRHDGHRILVLDLGSSNGTYVNGRRIPPNLEQLVQNGDVIALGRFKIQLLASNMEKG